MNQTNPTPSQPRPDVDDLIFPDPVFFVSDR